MQLCRISASSRPFTASSKRARRALVVQAQRKDVGQAPSPRAAGAALLAAATLALNVTPALDPSAMMLQPAYADDETSEEYLTPYQRRQRELERRREMLRQAREQAESKAGAEAVAGSSADADAAVEAANAERRAMTERLGSELKSSAASTYESTTSRYRGFGGFNSTPAPAPAPAPAPVAEPEPAPAPKPSFFSAPRQEPKPEPVVEVKKPAPAPAPAKKVEEPKKQQPAGKQKRRGPLPLFLAEVLVLGSFASVGLAVTKYAAQTNKALALAGAKAKELYGAAEQAIAKAQTK